jgi:hypothetical protein
MKLRRIVDMEFLDGIAADHADHSDHATRRRCRERPTGMDWLEILVRARPLRNHEQRPTQLVGDCLRRCRLASYSVQHFRRINVMRGVPLDPTFR